MMMSSIIMKCITLFALEGISQVSIFHTLIPSWRMVSALALTEPVQVLDVDWLKEDEAVWAGFP